MAQGTHLLAKDNARPGKRLIRVFRLRHEPIQYLAFGRTVLMALLNIPVLAAWSQTSDTTIAARNLTLSGYIETYYTHDFTAPKTAPERPGFLNNHKRNREVNINLALLKGAYTTQRIRANLAIQVGTYPQYNYAAEQDLVQNIFEANVGVRLTKTREWWLDAGVIPSHIGFESALSKECWTLTRSIVAENSPYYLSGAKLTYTSPDSRWTLLGGMFNGWQRIRRLDGYSGMSISTQVQFRPSDRIILNWSTFWGSDRPDSLQQGRMYHNLYALWQPDRRWGVIFGFDVGADDQTRRVNGRLEKKPKAFWYSPVAIVRYTATDRLRLALRVEYYDDRYGVITGIARRPQTPNGFQTLGYSVNFDYVITPQALFRVEGKRYDSRDAIFETTHGLGRTNTALTTSLAVNF